MIIVKPKTQDEAVLVPDGTYDTRLSKVTLFENAYGERVGFELRLIGGGVDGVKVLRSTSPALSTKGKLAEVQAGLLGRETRYRRVFCYIPNTKSPISRGKEKLGHIRSRDAQQKFHTTPYPRTTPNLSRYGHKKPL